MDFYRKLEVRPVINCATTYTRLGGSIMAPEVAQAMADAAGVFVRYQELQEGAGRYLADLTNNEMAMVTNGAAAGLCLAAAACMTGDDPALMHRLPNGTEGMRNEIVVHHAQHNWYDFAIRQTGAKQVEIGHTMETQPWELDAAINERTAAVFYFYGSHLNRYTLPLEYVVERAHARGVPVVVDAAAQVPPRENLWRFTRDIGVDLAIFSGGKGMCGPQNSGLVVGNAELIRCMQLNASPIQRIGRPMKVSKEAIIGLVAAVERYMNLDLDAEWQRASDVIDSWLASWTAAANPGTMVWREEINEAGEPLPRILLRVTPDSGATRDGLVTTLGSGEPPIEVVLHDAETIALSAHLLQAGEAPVVEEQVAAVLRGLRAK